MGVGYEGVGGGVRGGGGWGMKGWGVGYEEVGGGVCGEIFWVGGKKFLCGGWGKWGRRVG